MILHSQKRIDVLLDDDPKFQFTGAQRSDFFQSIKESNCHITVSNKSRQVRKVPGPKFERSAEELEFSTDDMSTVANTDKRGPNIFRTILVGVKSPRPIPSFLNIVYGITLTAAPPSTNILVNGFPLTYPLKYNGLMCRFLAGLSKVACLANTTVPSAQVAQPHRCLAAPLPAQPD
jgi:hypothetical protein